METKVIPVKNRIEYDHVESNLVYPSQKEYNWVCQLDKEWVISKLHTHFGSKVNWIGNKYVIAVEVFGKELLLYQHDKNTWLIEPIGK